MICAGGTDDDDTAAFRGPVPARAERLDTDGVGFSDWSGGEGCKDELGAWPDWAVSGNAEGCGVGGLSGAGGI